MTETQLLIDDISTRLEHLRHSWSDVRLPATTPVRQPTDEAFEQWLESDTRARRLRHFQKMFDVLDEVAETHLQYTARECSYEAATRELQRLQERWADLNANDYIFVRTNQSIEDLFRVTTSDLSALVALRDQLELFPDRR